MITSFGKRKNLWKLGRVSYLDTPGDENFDEIALSLSVKDIQALLCFSWPFFLAYLLQAEA